MATKLTQNDLLILLIEECGEVIQAATKCLRFGWDVDHGVQYANNRDMLAKEIGELTAVRDELELDCGPCQKPFMDGWKDKIDRAESAKEKYGRTSSGKGD